MSLISVLFLSFLQGDAILTSGLSRRDARDLIISGLWLYSSGELKLHKFHAEYITRICIGLVPIHGLHIT